MALRPQLTQRRQHGGDESEGGLSELHHDHLSMIENRGPNMQPSLREGESKKVAHSGAVVLLARPAPRSILTALSARKASELPAIMHARRRGQTSRASRTRLSPVSTRLGTRAAPVAGWERIPSSSRPIERVRGW